MAAKNTANSVAPVHCSAKPPAAVGSKGPADRLFTGTPAAATLCVYGFSNSGASERSEFISGPELKTLIQDLDHAKSTASEACVATRVDPGHLLVMESPDGSTQERLIDLSGCGTVGNGRHSVLLPAGLRQRIAS